MKKLLLILIFVIFLVGCSETPTGSVTKEPIKTQAQEITQQTETESQETKPKQPETPKEIIYSMNQNIKVDDLIYKVTKVETFTEMGSSMFKKETNGKFIKVYLDITNNAKETQQIFTPRFKIIDNQDRKYDRLAEDMMYISDYLELGKQLQPGLTSSGAIVFELPKDSTELKLIIRGDWLSVSEVKIELSNINNIGKDTTQKEEIDDIMDEAMEDSEEIMEKAMEDSQKMIDDLMKDFPGFN